MIDKILKKNQTGKRINYTQSDDIKNGMAYDVFQYTLNGCE